MCIALWKVYFQEMRKNEVFIDIIERLTVVREADVSVTIDSCQQLGNI